MPEKTEVSKERTVEEEKRIKLSMSIVETGRERADESSIVELREQWIAREITFGEYIDAVRKVGGDVLFGDISITGLKTDQIEMEKVMGEYRQGNISMRVARRLIEEMGAETSFWDWEFEKNPNHRPEESKIGFTWNPFHSRKGIFMQNITKRVIIKMADFIYQSVLKYDNDSFNFGDSRLIYLRDHVKKHLIDNVNAGYKKDLVMKALDVLLFIMKEDVYYRAMIFKMINEAPHNFTITDEEMEYFNRSNPSAKEVTEK